MKPLAISKKQFVSWLIVTGAACTMFMLTDQVFAGIAAGILAFSQFIFMTPDERSRHLTWRDLFYIVIGLSVLIMIILGVGHWVPKSEGETFYRFFRLIVIPVWIGCVWVVYRRWKLSQRDGHDAA